MKSITLTDEEVARLSGLLAREINRFTFLRSGCDDLDLPFIGDDDIEFYDSEITFFSSLFDKVSYFKDYKSFL